MGEFGPQPDEILDEVARDNNEIGRGKLSSAEQAIVIKELVRPERLGLDLFLVNKAAKRRRDSAIRAYERGDYDLAHEHSLQKSAYYHLKDKILNGMEWLGLISPIGVHVQKKVDRWERKEFHESDCECMYCMSEDVDGEFRRGFDLVKEEREEPPTYLKLFEIDGFRFHTIIDPDEFQWLQHHIGEAKDLGEWNSHPQLNGVKPLPIEKVSDELFNYSEEIEYQIENILEKRDQQLKAQGKKVLINGEWLLKTQIEEKLSWRTTPPKLRAVALISALGFSRSSITDIEKELSSYKGLPGSELLPSGWKIKKRKRFLKKVLHILSLLPAEPQQ